MEKMMKKLRNLSIALSISLLLSATLYAGDMHSDAIRPLPSPTPMQMSTTPEPAAPSGSNTADAESVEFLDLTVETLHLLLNILPIV
jgi:hypothetical protein